MTIPILPEQENNSMFLYVHSPTMSSGNMPVYTGSSGGQSLAATMLMAGMPSENAPLYMGAGSGVIATGDFMLYVDAVEGGGGNGTQGTATLSLKGNSSTPIVSSHTLSLLGPEFIAGSGQASLHMDAGDWLPASGDMALVSHGVDPSSGSRDLATTLVIKSRNTSCGSAELVTNGSFLPTGTSPGSYGDGAFASYSVSRKVDDDYSGPLIRITRVADTGERDFYEGEIEGEEIGGEILNNADFGGLAHWSAANGFNITGGQAVNDGTNTSTATLFQNDPWGDFDYYVLEFEIISCSDFYSAGMRVAQSLDRNFGTYFGVVTTGKRRVLLNAANFATNVVNREFFGFFAEAGVSLTVEYVSLKGYSASEAEVWVSGTEVQPMCNSDSNGLVSKLYDQSGNSRHLEAALSIQPALFVRGLPRIGQAFQGDPKRGSMSLSGSKYLSHSLSVSMNDSYPVLSSVVGSHTDAYAGFLLSLHKSGTSSTYIGHTLRDLGGNDIGYWGVRDGGSVSPATEPATAEEFHHSVGWSTGTSSHNIYVDDSAIDTDTVSVDFPTGLDTIYLGRLRNSGSQFVFKGNGSEVIIYNSDVTGDIDEIQKSSNAYYGIYEMVDGSYYGWSLVNASLSAGTAASNSVSSGSEFITNGGFDTTSSWTTSNISISLGRAQTISPSGASLVSQSGDLDAGITYDVSIDFLSLFGSGGGGAGNVVISVGSTDEYTIIGGPAPPGTISFQITPSETGAFKISTAGSLFTIDNVSVKAAASPPSVTLEDVALSAGKSYQVSLRVLDLENSGSNGSLQIKVGGNVEQTITGKGDLGTQSFSVTPTTSGSFQIASATALDKWQISKVSILEQDNCGVTLFIEKDFNCSEYTQLFLQNNATEAESLPMSVSGKFIQTDDISLFLKPPEAGDTTLFNRGFSE